MLTVWLFWFPRLQPEMAQANAFSFMSRFYLCADRCQTRHPDLSAWCLVSGQGSPLPPAPQPQPSCPSPPSYTRALQCIIYI